MPVGFNAIEARGAIDEQRQLHLDGPLPVAGPCRVRVLILIPDHEQPDEREWLRALAANPVFDFLNDPAEDVYKPTDGKPFTDEHAHA